MAIGMRPGLMSFPQVTIFRFDIRVESFSNDEVAEVFKFRVGFVKRSSKF